MKYPFIVEFTGTPESGKTTCIKTVLKSLKLAGIKAAYVQEPSEILASTKIPKSTFDSHLALRLLSIINLLKSKYEDYDLILVDRGVIDGIIFTMKCLSDNPNHKDECLRLISLLKLLNNTVLTTNLLIILKCSPTVAIKRKGHKGKFVNYEFLENYNKLLDSFKNSINCANVEIDTSNFTPSDIANTTYKLILTAMNKFNTNN